MVIKRDGSKQLFEWNKVITAVNKAFNSVKQPVPDKFLNQIKIVIENKIDKNDDINVEDIQDVIQNELIKKNYYDVVESFILYRNRRAEIRENNSKLIKDIQKKLKGGCSENQNANLDEDSFSGRLGEAADIVAKNEALKNMSKIARKNHENNIIYTHDLNNYVIGSHNCLSVPIDVLLSKGFSVRNTDIRAAGNIKTALQLVPVLFQLQSLQQFGGVSATHLDYSMRPYVKKTFKKYITEGLRYILETEDHDMEIQFKHMFGENYETPSIDDYKYPSEADYPAYSKVYKYACDKTKEDVYQAVEAAIHNLNSLLSRSGGQLPFSSINFGSDTSTEGRLVSRAILEKTIEGVGKYGKTSIFPCEIFQYSKYLHGPGKPNRDLYLLALKCTAQRLYPNYCNLDWTVQKGWISNDRDIKKNTIQNLNKTSYSALKDRIIEYPEIAEKLFLKLIDNEIIIDNTEKPYEISSTMGCRTINGFDINFEDVYKENIKKFIEDGVLKYDDVLSGAQKDGRGNICPVTIILPELAMQTPGELGMKDVDKFINLLYKKIQEAKDALLERFNHICNQSPGSAKFMWDNKCMAGYNKEEGTISALKHGTLAIGQIGLSETLKILIGKDHTTEEGMALAKVIEGIFNEYCAKYKEQYKLNFGVYYTPAENLCKTSMLKFKEKYGEIPGISDRKFFTNSIHIPVFYDINPFEKIDIEAQLTGFSNAGCITYVELPSSAKNNIEALATIVDYAMDKDIPYFAINVPVDRCQNCGYTNEINDKCPKCGSSDIQRLRRVTGYLNGDYKSSFNDGKQQEVEMRVKHVKN